MMSFRFTLLLLMYTCSLSVQAQGSKEMYNERLIPFCNQNGKWGYLDGVTGKEMIPPRYDDAGLFKNGIAEVKNKNPKARSRFDDGLTGWIDMSGKEIFSAQFTEVYEVKTPSDSILTDLRAVTTQSGEEGVLSISGKWILAPGKYKEFVFFDEHHYLGDSRDYFADGKKYSAPKDAEIISVDKKHRLFYFQKKDDLHKGLCTWEGEILLSPDFLAIKYLPVSQHILASRIKEDGSPEKVLKKIENKGDAVYSYLLDGKGKELARFAARYTAEETNDSTGTYTSGNAVHYFSLITGQPVAAALAESKGGYAVFKAGDYYGLKNKQGKVLLSPRYRKLDFVRPDFIIASGPENYKAGVIDVNGKEILPFDYNSLDYFYPHRNVLAQKNNKYGLINEQGKVLVDFKYDNYFYFNDAGLAEVYAEGKSGVIDTTGKEVIPVIYKSVFDTKELDKTVKTYYTAEKNERWGLLSATGKVLIPFNYGYVTFRKEDADKGWVQTEDTIRRHNGIFNIQTGVIIPPVYDIIRCFEDFIIVGKRAGNDYIYQLLSITGKPVTDMSYDKMDYEYGYLTCRKNKLNGVLNTKGKIMVPFKYNTLWRKTPHLLIAQQGENYFYINTEGKEFRRSD